MTSPERAKGFLQNRASGLAMRAAALAAMGWGALPAEADVLFSFTSCIVHTLGDTVTGGCTASVVGTQPNGSNGLHLTGDATGSSTLSGLGTMALTMDWTGTATGTPSSSLPLNWDFTPFVGTVSTSGGSGQILPSLTYALNFFINGSMTKSAGGGATSGTLISGSDSLTTSSAVTSWEVLLTVTDTIANSNTSLEIQVPTSSVDINNPRCLSHSACGW